ncbi:MAG: hypothetical protein N2561_10080 [Bacteroidetes bacterium]|nr:hypothetical protein [Rhodothermia bacterium]MCS7155280.1 hypothetical protein [Bacteroidota bacterium]MCX7907865.1 hypothetical protein [Bacteroidota bacterium]MDW8138684.1 hypothetical protein [Bacteroidota bacterium]MDW8284730.1 hypothetical protein [Bacteroidota bacterium]
MFGVDTCAWAHQEALGKLGPYAYVLTTLSPQGPAQTPSPAMAFTLFAVVPGAGQLYTGRALPAALFAFAEALAWLGVAYYRAQGQKAFERVHACARQHWSVVRYAQWLNGYSGQ